MEHNVGISDGRELHVRGLGNFETGGYKTFLIVLLIVETLGVASAEQISEKAICIAEILWKSLSDCGQQACARLSPLAIKLSFCSAGTISSTPAQVAKMGHQGFRGDQVVSAKFSDIGNPKLGPAIM